MALLPSRKIQEKINHVVLNILRHGHKEVFLDNLPITNEGYFRLSDLYHLIETYDNITFLKFKFEKYFNKNTILLIIKECKKQRFSYKEEESDLLIRANQGHSLAVGSRIDFSKVLIPIDTPIPGAFHGSYKKNLESFKKEGVKRMNRFHIHIAKSLDAESGKRDSANLIVYVNMERAMIDGIKFYESINGVILTEGIDGILPPQYLSYALLDNDVLTIIE